MSKRAENKGGEPTATPKNRRTRADWQAPVDAWQPSNQTQSKRRLNSILQLANGIKVLPTINREHNLTTRRTPAQWKALIQEQQICV